jgi:transcription initiation factor IIF auxiliary subunit
MRSNVADGKDMHGGRCGLKPDKVLDEINFVAWTLYPTFPNPIRKFSNRVTKFRLETAGWSVFQIFVRLKMKNDKQIKLYYLKFHNSKSLLIDERLVS